MKQRKPIQVPIPDPALERIPASIRLGGAPHFIRNMITRDDVDGKWLLLGRDKDLPEGQVVEVFQRKDFEYVDVEVVEHIAERIVQHRPSSHSYSVYGPYSRWIMATFQAHGDGSR